MQFTLINARPSPFGRKVAIALIEKGLEVCGAGGLAVEQPDLHAELQPLEQLPDLDR